MTLIPDDIFRGIPGGDGPGRRLIGLAMSANSPRLCELAGLLGFDVLWLDLEHGSSDPGDLEQLCLACQAAGALPAARVIDHQPSHVLRALEAGARLVIVPMVNTAEQARQIVAIAKFPPLGRRGYNTRSRGVEYGIAGAVAGFAAANQRTHLFAQIESLEAVANLESICAVEGLCGVLLGPGDLSASMGCLGDMKNPRLIETVASCIAQARAQGKHAGILVSPGPLLDAALAAGCDLAFVGGDVASLVPAWRELAAKFPSARQHDAAATPAATVSAPTAPQKGSPS